MTRCNVKRLLSVILAGVFFLSLIPYPAAAGNSSGTPLFRRIRTAEELVSGRYLLVTDSGFGPGVLAGDLLTAAAVTVDETADTAQSEAVWTLTADDGVTLTDSNGVTVAPSADGSSGITEGSCRWQVSCEEGYFSFHSFSGETPVTLAGNVSEGFLFRAYRDEDIAAGEENYSRRFALYRMEETATAPETQPTTVPTAPPPAEPVAEPEGEDFWYPVALADIQPEDTVAVTVTQGSSTWALSSGEGTSAPPPAEEVTVENGMLRSRGAALHWQVQQRDGGICLISSGGSLFCGEEDSGLGVGSQGDPLWTAENGQLRHVLTGRYLQISDGHRWTALSSPAGEQTLRFWRLGTPPPERSYGFYFGLLHAHTNISDGFGNVTDAFNYAAGVPGLDFFAVTDHSNSFDNDEAGSINTDGTAVSQEWAAGKAAAAAVTSETFVGIFGYEMTWQEGRHIGHINTFNTPGWQSREQEGYTAIEPYYQALASCPGAISQFNHPCDFYGYFDYFAGYTPERDRVMQLLEVGGEAGFTAYDAYNRALDAGWHVAPTNSQNNHNGSWGDANDARTVVLAESLTEQGLYAAMAQRRVYATEDCDLQLDYRLNGHVMGTILPPAESAQITLWAYDPTDAAVGTVEVIVDGGTVAATGTVSGNCGYLSISLTGSYRYYYLRITQSDGDIAVTAPVWLEQPEQLTITAFTADTAVPVQNRPVKLSVEIQNGEGVSFSLEQIQFSIGDQVIHTADAPGTVSANGDFRYEFTYTHPNAETADIQVTVTGVYGTRRHTLESSLTLSFRAPELTGDILVDAGHGNGCMDRLNHFISIAAGVHMRVISFVGSLPEGGRLLLIFAPENPFSQEFVSQVIAFVEKGGSLILCGQPGRVLELNRLLIAIGSTLRLADEPVGSPLARIPGAQMLYLTEYNPDAPLCQGLPEGSLYCHQGVRVDPGQGQWLVRSVPEGDGEAAVVLACEQTGSGGTVLVAGDLFLADDRMPQPQNQWDPPRINQRIAENLLGAQRTELPLTSIELLRQGQQDQVFRIRGYVTAGTANPYNTFPDTLYLQDDTGGIPISGFREAGISVGTPMEFIGRLDTSGPEPKLIPISWQKLELPHYRYVPRTSHLSETRNFAANGGLLMQVESTVAYVTHTPDGKGISSITLTDSWGDVAYIRIEDAIRSGAYGTNLLARDIKPGRRVRCLGILSRDEDGTCYLRVRNCDEVVYVPPGYNPPTADRIFLPASALVTSTLSLICLLPRRRKRG